MSQSNSTRSLKTFGRIKSPAIDRSSQSAADISVFPTSINPAEFEVAKGFFQKSSALLPTTVNAYAALLCEAAKQRNVSVFDIADINVANGAISFDSLGLTLINNLRPEGSKVGHRTNDNANAQPFVKRNILP